MPPLRPLLSGAVVEGRLGAARLRCCRTRRAASGPPARPPNQPTNPRPPSVIPARFKSLAGQCARCLRLDAQLLVAYHLHELAVSSHLCEEEDVKELHPAIGALARWGARWRGGARRAAQRSAPLPLPCAGPPGPHWATWATRLWAPADPPSPQPAAHSHR
jgi:hypothetical protein